jgi:ABC-type lipoprotein export system ATPase subunit
MGESILCARGVTKVFEAGRQQVRALRGVDLEVRAGEFMALVGPSGSGKTTFLNLAGALDVPTAGELTVLGRDIAALSSVNGPTSGCVPSDSCSRPTISYRY